MTNSQLRILILRPDRLGDVVLSTPLPREIKKKNPNAFVTVLVRNYTKDIYMNNPFVDELLVEEELGNSFWKKVIRVRKSNFTHAISLFPTEKNNWLLFFSGIKIRIGVGHKFYQFLSNAKSIYRRKYIPLRNEADYCLDALRKIGIENPDTSVSIYLSDEEKKRALEMRKSFPLDKKIFVGIHATSGKSSPNIPLIEYRKLAELLVRRKDIQIFITVNEIPDELKNIAGVIYPCENYSLRDSIIVFSALDILISASTGPMHIAAALKVKTLSLFCPLPACEPKLWGPQGNEAYFVMPEENYCGKVCTGDPHTCTFEGNGGINAEKIVEQFTKIYPLDAKN
ncbi:MAG: glycosyltransferase family 9 protein [Ignavibacteriaceae bacterium]|jgi:heptosyltransferase-2